MREHLDTHEVQDFWTSAADQTWQDADTSFDPFSADTVGSPMWIADHYHDHREEIDRELDILRMQELAESVPGYQPPQHLSKDYEVYRHAKILALIEALEDE